MYYSKFLGEALKERLEQLQDIPALKRLRLYDDILLVESAVCDAVALWSSLADNKGKIVGNSKREVTQGDVDAAFQRVLELSTKRAELVEKQYRMEQTSSDKVSLSVLDLFITQILRAIHTVVGNDKETITRIQEAIEQTVRLPNANSMDSNIEADILRGSVGPTTKAMDEVTAPSRPGSSVVLNVESEDSRSGSSVGKNGTGKKKSG
jgi:hypothetical protein